MEQWRINLYVLVVSFVVFTIGATFIVPFIPLFIEYELGITDSSEIAFWSGLAISITFISQTFISPFWGSVADKYGRKIMVIRAVTAVGIFIFLISYTNSVYSLITLRLMMGLASGFNAAATSLVVTSVPKEKMGQSLGLLETGHMTGLMIGPIIGGILASFWSYRVCFLISAVSKFLLLPFIILLLKEPNKQDSNNSSQEESTEKKPQESLWTIYKDGFVQVGLKKVILVGMFALICGNFFLRGMEPIISIFVSNIYDGSYFPLPLTVSIMFSITAFFSITMAPILGKMGDKHGFERIIMFSLVLGAVVASLHSLVDNIWLLAVLRAGLGITVAGIVPLSKALISSSTPWEKRGRVYGITASANSLGNAAGPLISGSIVSLFGFNQLFHFQTVLLLIVFMLVYRVSKRAATG